MCFYLVWFVEIILIIIVIIIIIIIIDFLKDFF